MLLIRADGNAKAGAGHMMRCLSVAEAAAEQTGGRTGIRFVCADGDSAELARSRGFEAEALQTDYRDMESELPFWEQAADADRPVILVDSYYVTDRYLRALRAYGKVYLMDDMQQHAFPVDGVINYNIFADLARYRDLYAGTGTECLLGARYIPLRKQFLGVEYKPAERVRDVLLTTGGGDADNVAEAVLKSVYRDSFTYHVLVGRFSPNLERWRNLAGERRNIRVYSDVQDMAGLLRKCDLALTAGGSTVYELAAVGVPFICFSYAENQEALTEYIGEKKIAGYAGAWHLDEEAAAGETARLFEQFCGDGALRRQCSAAERALVDGDGARRLAAELLKGTKESPRGNS